MTACLRASRAAPRAAAGKAPEARPEARPGGSCDPQGGRKEMQRGRRKRARHREWGAICRMLKFRVSAAFSSFEYVCRALQGATGRLESVDSCNCVPAIMLKPVRSSHGGEKASRRSSRLMHAFGGVDQACWKLLKLSRKTTGALPALCCRTGARKSR
jgi:hypothetical protein